MPGREWTVDCRHLMEDWMRQLCDGDFEDDHFDLGLPRPRFDELVEVDHSYHAVQALSEFGAAIEVLDRTMASRRERLCQLKVPPAIVESFGRAALAEDLERVAPGAWRYVIFEERFELEVAHADL